MLKFVIIFGIRLKLIFLKPTKTIQNIYKLLRRIVTRFENV